jgi:endosialidase-like protein
MPLDAQDYYQTAGQSLPQSHARRARINSGDIHMARRKIRNFIALAGFSATAAYATPPSTPFTPTTDNGRNTAIGSGTLNSLGTPDLGVKPWIAAANTAAGVNSLNANTSGSSNTGIGADSLNLNTTGDNNTAVGQAALLSNVSGNNSNAVGSAALDSNISGNNNNAMGFAALFSNTTGNSNTASGSYALFSNSTASSNSAQGYEAMYSNTTGANNTAVGYQALYASTTANYSSAIGYQALNSSHSGLGNIGVGPFAGKNIIQGELNIDIGSWGSADESNTVRIGISPYHAHTYIAGIYNTTGLNGLPVIVTSTGQLGVAPVSSERFKTGIATMGTATENLSQLRPVTFKLRSDAQGTVHYGLIAEEVAKVYPELVVRDENGRIDGVHYDELAPMLLNEVQKEQATVATLIAEHEADAVKIASLERRLTDIQAALGKLQPTDQLVAQQ